MRRKREAESLGKRLFFDRRGPIATYPNGKYYNRGQKRTSSADVADDPDDPARLIKALQSTGPGCRWLLDRWAELRAASKRANAGSRPRSSKPSACWAISRSTPPWCAMSATCSRRRT